MINQTDQLTACQVCGSYAHTPSISHKTGLSTDLQLSSVPLEKIQCVTCGLVRSANTRFLESFYKESYQKAESDVVTSVLSGNQTVVFSSLIEDWVKSIAGDYLASAHSILEVGCGDGRLLNRLNGTRKVGLEPSNYLFELARKNCKDCVLENVGIESYDSKDQFDVVLAVNVFEHLLDPKSFLKKTAALLSRNGVVILIFPTQEQFNYDVCFIDHLFHMRLAHLNYLAEECGLKIVKQEVGYQSYQVANAVVLKNAFNQPGCATELSYFDNENPLLMQDIFRHFKEVMAEFNNRKKITAFGYGELSKVFGAYAENFDCIEYFIDDFYKGQDKCVIRLEKALDLGILDKALLVFLVNPYYRRYIVDKLRVAGGPSHIYFPIDKEIITL